MNLKEKDELTSALLDTVSVIAQAEDKKGSYNITIAAIVKDRKPDWSEYTLDYQGTSITAYPLVPGIEFLLGSKVLVLVPNGNLGLKKFILSEY